MTIMTGSWMYMMMTTTVMEFWMEMKTGMKMVSPMMRMMMMTVTASWTEMRTMTVMV